MLVYWEAFPSAWIIDYLFGLSFWEAKAWDRNRNNFFISSRIFTSFLFIPIHTPFLSLQLAHLRLSQGKECEGEQARRELLFNSALGKLPFVHDALMNEWLNMAQCPPQKNEKHLREVLTCPKTFQLVGFLKLGKKLRSSKLFDQTGLNSWE